MTAGGLALTAAIGVPVLFAYAYTHLARNEVPKADLGTAYEDVKFKTSDDLQLEAWYIPSKNGAAVISSLRSSRTRAHRLTCAI